MPPTVPAFDPFDGLVVFAVSLLIGGAAIHVAAKHVAFRRGPGGLTYEHAVVTALLGAVAWALLSWIPLVGSLLALAGWIAVIHCVEISGNQMRLAVANDFYKDWLEENYFPMIRKAVLVVLHPSVPSR